MNMVIFYFFESDGFLFVLRSNNDLTNNSKQLLLNTEMFFKCTRTSPFFKTAFLELTCPLKVSLYKAKTIIHHNERYSNSVFIVCIAISLFLHHCNFTHDLVLKPRNVRQYTLEFISLCSFTAYLPLTTADRD